jgi:hypothetical protein
MRYSVDFCSLYFRTVEYVDAHGGRFGVGGAAGVEPRVCRQRLLDQQAAGGGGALFRHQRDAAARRVKVDVVAVVLPRHRRRRLGREPHHARHVDGAADVDEHLAAVHNLRFGLCEKTIICILNTFDCACARAFISLVKSRSLCACAQPLFAHFLNSVNNAHAQ